VRSMFFMWKIITVIKE